MTPRRAKRRKENEALSEASGHKRIKLKSRKWYVRNLDQAAGDKAKAAFRLKFGDYCLFCDFRGATREIVTDWFHFVSRYKYASRWLEINGGASCRSCNYAYERDSDFISKVVDWYKQTFGTETWERLIKAYHSTAHFSRHDLAEMLEDLQKHKANATIVE